ncbi:tyrosine-type recombinase/integrase [Burkholderia cepacia]|uniref:tyrosine-type recombinase/integrase n=1 Tax=Burkholderia TaxID=32008 RepID=UPI001E4BAE08|nr:tyrosine-type recombinase/integrase [Burkholderia cepacia]
MPPTGERPDKTGISNAFDEGNAGEVRRGRCDYLHLREVLRVGQVRSGVIQFARTKSGKARAVPIVRELTEQIAAHHTAHGVGERIFASAFAAFRSAIDRANIVLPDGQLTHVLRHTFASHFMIRGGNILTLQRILGHQSLMMTMRYAHLAPDHLEEARRLNPLVRTSQMQGELT